MWIVFVCLMAPALLHHWKQSQHRLIDFLGLGVVYLYARLWHRWNSNGLAPLPARGPAILVANHTCSADPAFLTAGCSRILSFLIASEFYNIPLLRRLLIYMGCVAVHRHGRDTTAVRTALRRLADGAVVCVFPEGGLSNAGRKRLRQGKAGVALMALRSRAPVYPALITGGPQTYSLKRAWFHPSRVHVTFAPAVDLSGYYERPIDRKLLEEVTRYLMEQIAALEQVPDKRH